MQVRHVSFMQICNCCIFLIVPHLSHISSKCAYRIFFLHKLICKWTDRQTDRHIHYIVALLVAE